VESLEEEYSIPNSANGNIGTRASTATVPCATFVWLKRVREVMQLQRGGVASESDRVYICCRG
jgi:hypothetical protein